MGRNKGTDNQMKESQECLQGKVFISKDGFSCRVLEYRGVEDIDIIFEDSFVKRVGKSSLLQQSFKKHDYTLVDDVAKNYVGKHFVNKKGYRYFVSRVEVIEGRKYAMVIFDGELHERRYLPRDIVNNEVNNYFNSDNAIGLKFENSVGDVCKVVKYRKSIDVTVEFENGETCKVSMNNLKKGFFSKPSKNFKNKDRLRDEFVGKKFVNKKGEEFTVINYVTAHLVEVVFTEGLAKVVTSIDFVRRKKVSHPKTNYQRDRKQEVFGKIFTNRSGISCVCNKYVKASEVHVVFENTGEVGVYALGNLLRGEFAPPSEKRDIDTYRNKVTGEIFVSNFGEKATVVNYIDSRNVQCLFEDGMTAKFRLSKLKSGNFAHPKRSTANKDNTRDRVVGSVFVNRFGMKVTCIEYKDTNNVKCMFEDGEIVTSSMGNLKKRSFSHPVLNNMANSERACSVYMMKGADGTILYIGRSVQLEIRLYQHFSRHIREDKDWYFDVKSIEYCTCPSTRAMVNLENFLINKFKPLGNRKVDRYEVNLVESTLGDIVWETYDIGRLAIYRANVVERMKEEYIG